MTQRQTNKISDTISQLGLTELQAQFIHDRYYDQLSWFQTKASYNKKRYQFIRIITLFGAASITALTAFSLLENSIEVLSKITTIAVSLAVTFLAGLEEIFNYGESWRNYRRTSELLKAEWWQFTQLTGPYRKYKAHTDAFQKFAERVEAEISNDVHLYITEVAPEEGR